MLYETSIAELDIISISWTFPSHVFFQQRHVPWVLAKIMTVKCFLFRNSRHRFFNDCLSEFLGKLLYTHPLLGAHVISGEGGGLILGEWHSQGYDHMLVVFVLLLLEETTITLKVFLWRFPFNFIWKCTIMLSKNSWHLVLEIEVY